MSDITRIRQNVELMASKGAPISDIDGYLAIEGLTPESFKQALTPDRSDTALKYSAGSGLANLIDLPGRTVTAAGNLMRMGAGYLGNKAGILTPEQMPQPMDPTSLDFANPAARKLGLVNDQYAPQDGVGHITDLTTQAFTGGGINPAAIGRNLISGMVRPVLRDVIATGLSGAGAGTGVAIANNIDTGNQSLNTGLQAGIPMLTGAAGMPVAARGTAGDRSAAALRGVTPNQIETAKRIQATANKLGSPVTGYEAIQSATGINPKMQTQQRIAEQSDAAATNLTPMMQARPDRNSIIMDNVTAGISPKERFPDSLAGKLQDAAQSALTRARQVGDQKAQPYYDLSSNNPTNVVPFQSWQMMAADDGVMAALKAVKNDPYSGLQNVPPGSMMWLDQAKKWLDGKIEVSRREGDQFAVKQMELARQKIIAAADTAFPIYAKARSTFEDHMNDVVNPMQQGQVGKLSRSDNFPQQSETLLPNAPSDVTPSVVTKTASTIGAEDPSILARFLAQDLRRKYNEQAQNTVSGEPVGGGARFAANVAGNEGQRGNLIAALRGAGSDAVPMLEALDVFQAQGMKPPVNSATAANAAEMGMMGSLFSPIKSAQKLVEKWTHGWASKDLAKALTDPDSVQRLQELARINGTYSPMKQQMLIQMLMANPTNEQAQGN